MRFSLVLILSGYLLATEDPFAAARRAMVRNHIEARGVRNRAVLDAMRTVPRHLFVPESWRVQAYEDHPLPVGHGQTISQPYIVAVMTELLQPSQELSVLEIGTGSGYQAAILSPLVKHVYSIEIVPELARRSGALLKKLGYANISVHEGDGYKGLPEHAPFDRIILTAAPPEIPQALLDQLKPGGRLVGPVGPTRYEQTLLTIDKSWDGKLRTRTVAPVMFVPMVEGEPLAVPR